MKKKMLEQIKNTLLEQKKVLKSKNYHEEVDIDGDDTDAIQGTLIMRVNSQLSTRDREKMLQIEKALSKIAEKTYGSCEECEEAIADKRLLANPYVPTCISCAEKNEMLAKQNARNGRDRS